MELLELINESRVVLLGQVRQELLCGIKDPRMFNLLRDHLRTFPDFACATADFETAAGFYNILRSKGLQGANTDFLICAVSVRTGFPVYTDDGDFTLFSRYLPVSIYKPRVAGFRKKPS